MDYNVSMAHFEIQLENEDKKNRQQAIHFTQKTTERKNQV